MSHTRTQTAAPTQKQLQRLYFALWWIVIANASLAILGLFNASVQHFWHWYVWIYLFMLVSSTWYNYVLVAKADLEEKDLPAYRPDMLISVVIPCFNESLELFSKSIESVLRADGSKEIIIIDDGSPGSCKLLTQLLSIQPNTKVHLFAANQGKREALHYAVSHLVSKDSFCTITIDSDTIVSKDAFTLLASALRQQHVGAVTGDVLLLNEKQNLLTRMIGSYYWIGLNVFKKAQSAIGVVVCCSGCLAAYRTDVLRQIIDEFHEQTFLGERCTHSEDRHLTNLVLRRGYKVHFVEKAKSYTETPHTFAAFCRQQLRWKRGFVRESVYTVSYAFRNQKRLFWQLISWDLLATYVSFGLHMYFLLLLFFDPLFVVGTILPMWFIAMTLRYSYVFMHARDKSMGVFMYGLLFEFVMYWISIYALFTVKNRSWVTRSGSVL